MGRQPKDPAERKSLQHAITTRLDEAERAQLDELTLELRVTAGEVMRRALRDFYTRVFPKAKR
jgi:predicted transcriptional regulator